MDLTALWAAIPTQWIPYVTAAVTLATLVIRIVGSRAPTATSPGWWRDLYAALHMIANFQQPPAPPPPAPKAP
jgi:hypothetical protein